MYNYDFRSCERSSCPQKCSVNLQGYRVKELNKSIKTNFVKTILRQRSIPWLPTWFDRSAQSQRDSFTEAYRGARKTFILLAHNSHFPPRTQLILPRLWPQNDCDNLQLAQCPPTLQIWDPRTSQYE